jgi:hypothetical protein
MLFWKFIKAVVIGAWLAAWEWSHRVHHAGILVGGAVTAAALFVGWEHPKEGIMVLALPVFALVVVFFWASVRHTYKLYKAEFDKRVEAERRLAEYQQRQSAEEDRRRLAEERERERTRPRRESAEREWAEMSDAQRAAVRCVWALGQPTDRELLTELERRGEAPLPPPNMFRPEEDIFGFSVDSAFVCRGPDGRWRLNETLRPFAEEFAGRPEPDDPPET